MLIKEHFEKDGLLQDEDFKMKDEEFTVVGEDLRTRGMKIKKIKNFNFLSDLIIKK